MAKDLYHIINKATKTSAFCDKYEVCRYSLANKSKSYRQTHKIISDEEYQKIIKKKPVL
ncbi:MAG: hypothetical protein J6M39_06670 [Lachnospiraceae bacterium]|nr:hypothetical protein [Lachnospiraceae bacterium]